uniref:uncharacterized protein LOC124067929 isoform X2 n=1 Tax=Scatophagus argus TaxID=75038 RepID=UPI001ED8393F|nr:uncharacterized protein LOC124067929 isoform X2 [Scatophagus argus]
MGRLTRFCFLCGQSLDFLSSMEQSVGPNAQRSSQDPDNAKQTEKLAPHISSSWSPETPRGRHRAKERKHVQRCTRMFSNSSARTECEAAVSVEDVLMFATGLTSLPPPLVWNHPSIFYTAYPSGSRGSWSLSQLTTGERRGSPWTGCQSIAGPGLEPLPQIEFLDDSPYYWMTGDSKNLVWFLLLLSLVHLNVQ